MSFSALFFLLVYTIGVILSLTRGPWYGLILYLFVYYNFPGMRWWGGDLPNIPWSRTLVFIILFSYLIYHSKSQDESIWKLPQTKWFILLLLIMAFVTFSPLSVSREKSLQMFKEFIEFFLKFFLIVKILDTPQKWKVFIIINLIGCFYWGWEAYQHPDFSQGRLEGFGAPDTSEANQAPAHVVTFVPILIYYIMHDPKWRRILAGLFLAFTLNFIILSNSRGAVVGLIGAVFSFLIILPSRKKFQFVVGLIFASMLFIYLTDKRFLERQITITKYEEDGSSSGRIETWKGGLKLIQDHPLGVGGRGSDMLSPIYWGEIVNAHDGQLRTMHNTYLMMAADWGVLGFGSFFMLLLVSIIVLHRCGKKIIEDKDKENELGMLALALEAGFIGFLICSIFINRQWAEINYWIIALAGALQINILPNVNEKHN